ncbi:PqqD family protein [Nitratiruptor sp. YY09-18]|uniref:PqqD family protein n=1 Tax=Nitratiruptor sp. YY09-18 TaxID=2724901 RepID=UPI001916BC9C|nr:PqqD family protein [Nitratiruptor sp. YY09-18]BCD67470.1 hypothetical protein NitYY0918_C0363 [Nitratiruptor sp. YY09-18]
MLINELHIDQNNIAFVPSLGITFELNETGKEIIDLLKEIKTKDEIVHELAQKYEKDWREVYIDVEDFLLKLKLFGLYQ